MSAGKCWCGHDCARCITYLATVTGDAALRARAREFYKNEFGFDIPEDGIHCMGGRTEDVFALCRDCPFRKCCREKDVAGCDMCDEPCGMYEEYRDRYVNRCNQVQGEA